MAKGLKEGEPNGRDVYPDIIDHPHWESPQRPRMSLADRAAQFSSFDALAGYSDMVAEEQRLTDQEIELDDASLERLNRKLELIADAIAAGSPSLPSRCLFRIRANPAALTRRLQTGSSESMLPDGGSF